MSKVTLSAILTIVRIALSLGEKLVRSIYTIVDICDDSVINNSVPKPDWYSDLIRIINNLQLALQDLGGLSDKVYPVRPLQENSE